MQRNYLVMALGFSVLLTACTPLSSQLDCPAPKHQKRCQSLTAVDSQWPDHAGLSLSLQAKQTKTRVPLKAQPPLGSRVQRLWIAPFVDEQGYYHEANVIYTAVTPTEEGP